MAEPGCENKWNNNTLYKEIQLIRNEGLFCRKCVRYFATKFEFNEHVREHIEEINDIEQNFMSYIGKFICSSCGKVFEVKSDLMIHYNTVCLGAAYTCKHCRENCETSPFLQMHLMFHHNYSEEMLRDEGFLTDLDPFISERSFMKSSRRKAFEFPPLEGEFSSIDNAVIDKSSCSNRRSRKIRSNEKNLAFNAMDKAHTCEICKESFSRKCVLAIHIQQHFLSKTRKKRIPRGVSANSSVVKSCESNSIPSANALQEDECCNASEAAKDHSITKRAVLKPSNVVLGSSAWIKIKPKIKFKVKKTCLSVKNPKRKRKYTGRDLKAKSSKLLSQSSLDVASSAWKKIKLKSKLQNTASSNSQQDPGKLNTTKKTKSIKTKEEKKTPKNDGNQVFTCEMCKRLFKDSYKLKRHLLIHTGERPYCCIKCKKTFTRDDHLKRHVKKVCSKTAKI